MKTNSMELVFILDRSGSMAGLESDTIGGFNALLEKQKGETGEATVTTVLFDNDYDILHDRINIDAISNITEKDYYVRGSTALLDAIGKTIQKISNVQKVTKEDLRAEKVMFVITTDGMENSSIEYDQEKVKNLITRHKEEFGWEFIFLGANIDAIKTASHFGIHKDRAVNFNADKEGTLLNYEIIGEVISAIRDKKSIDPNWKSRIDEDFHRRGKKNK